ncbi:MAG: hypothetical protein WC859_07895 [Elusimicrobiota bacterium]|jgi:hypothetical protein
MAIVELIEQWPWLFGTGSILWSYGWFLANVCGVSMRRGPLLGVGVALLLGIGVFWGRSFAVIRKKDVPVACRPIETLMVLLIASTVVFAFWQTALPIYMWDSIVMYAFKAKILFTEGTFRTRAFQDSSLYHINADYPLLLSYLEASYFILLGRVEERWIRLIFLAYWLGWLSLIYRGLRLRWPRPWSLAGVAGLATLPLFFEEFMGQATSGFADIPLAFYWTGFLLAVFGWRQSPNRTDGWRAVLFAIGCAFTKAEGGPLLAIAGIAFLVTGRGLRRRFLWLAVVIGVGLIPWYVIRLTIPHNAAHFIHWPALAWSEALNRARWIGSFGIRELANVNRWGFFWLLVVGGFVWPQRKGLDLSGSMILVCIVLLQVGLYSWVYFIYPGDLRLLLPTTLPRLLIHVIGPLALAVAWRWRTLPL